MNPVPPVFGVAMGDRANRAGVLVPLEPKMRF